MAIQALENAPELDDPVLQLDNIQGDVLVGLQKDAECFVFFVIENAANFQRALRDAVRSGLITSTAEAVAQERALAAAKLAGTADRLSILGMNIGFSMAGLQKLIGRPDLGIIPNPAGVFDPSFSAGAIARAPALGDDMSKWMAPFVSDPPHGVLLVTGPDTARTDAHADQAMARFGSSVRVMHREMGMTRPQRGHEHFGFMDGISEPAIRGLTQRQNPLDINQGLPGQNLLWPGEFVFGYPCQMGALPNGSGRKEDKASIPVPAAWMQDGSFMVWRRLEQDVLAFRTAVRTHADALGMDPELLAARMVGRWPSGAPLVVAPLQDDPLDARDPFLNNDFKYGNDPHQRRCPYAAHIRKTYPRDDMNGIVPGFAFGEGGQAFVETHRLRRAGIPFGPEVGDGERVGAEASRGLMFVCYQTNIQNQFEFVQQAWANLHFFVDSKRRPGANGAGVTPGHDPIIGQAAGAQSATRTMDEPVPNYPTGSLRTSLELPALFVRPTAGGYFFMPSLSAMRDGPIVGT